ncbi:pyridoxamine 5'-phosphate oxidase family protein [Jiangella asiatica]|uniref:Pyridoxamine 5'-phosphate oxidase family protein n=1 Tax=Jiangella asiatica TaxID=2530372 RepID=A0A4R5DLQ7_9ACTN|nr:pyridoxamine 5'-phosphate oxidase family protein [Jiangella asiatica]TDE15039.1 pyridoxamine 5'-phosphate oxidase family protein [Jiangella asiatica]
MTLDDLAAHARSIIDANLYLTLGTVDADGRPWTSPVYFAPAGDREFCWTSAVDARHSRHLAERPQVSLVVFDSTVEPYHGRAVYAVGEARELSGDDVDRALTVYPRDDGRDVTRLTRQDVTGPAPYRLYQATASDLWILCPREPRQPCALHGLATDHRVSVTGADSGRAGSVGARDDVAAAAGRRPPGRADGPGRDARR